MKFKITTHELTGNPDQSGWVVSSDFEGRLVVVVSGKENPSSGNEIITAFFKEYLNKNLPQNTDPFKLLVAVIEKIKKQYSGVSLISAVFVDDQIFVAGIGTNECWIERSGKSAKILPAATGKNFASGILRDKDVFFLGPNGKTRGMTLHVSQVSEAPIIIPTPQTPGISPFRLTLAKGIDKILSLLPKKNLFVKEDLGEIKNTKRRKVSTTAGAILLSLLVISIFFGVKQQKLASQKSKYAGTLASAQHNLDEARNVATLDPNRARSLVLDANSQVQSLISQGIKDDNLTKLASDIKDAMGQIAGLYNQNPSLYLDLSLQTSGFKGTDMAEADNRMVVLDSAGKRLISIDIDTSKTATVAGPDIMPNAKNVAAYSDANFVTADNGVWEIGDQASIILKPDWGNNILPYAYAGNLYILDKDNSVVWRYQGDGGQFGAKQNWFGSGVKPDLSNIVSWAIDGNIWMLTKDNQILRFSGGSPIDFSLKDPDRELSAVNIFTTQDSKYLYILDSGNSRVLVVDKDGNYKAQYVSDNIKSATKIIVSEASKKIILLEGDKLYSLDIEHL